MPSLILPSQNAAPRKTSPPPPAYYDPRASATSVASASSSSSGSSTAPASIKGFGKRRFSASRTSSEFVRKTTNMIPVPDKLPVLDFKIESPPLVMYGAPKDSTGALLSGLLNLQIFKLKGQDFESCHLTLNARVYTRRPVQAHCEGCTNRVSPMKEWDFLDHPETDIQGHFRPGKHVYPFSFLLPGHLPSSTDSPIGSISYTLDAKAVTKAGDIIKCTHELKVSRSIIPSSVQERQSVRIFPPTALSARVLLPQVVHMGGQFPLGVQLDGIVSPDKSTRWKLRKLTWRIDECSKIVSPPCPMHESKVGGSGKGVLHEDTRSVASGELKSGWKTDWETGTGRFEMEVPSVGLPTNLYAAKYDPHGHVSNDVESSCGLSINHVLILEMIVAEENCPNARTRIVTPTGAARVLRMQFNLPVTERAGMGISWDEEQPPTYDDVPESPPTYMIATTEEIDVDEFQALTL